MKPVRPALPDRPFLLGLEKQRGENPFAIPYLPITLLPYHPERPQPW
jgi:hypothetical protein